MKIPDLLTFLQARQDIWDSRELPQGVLGEEPDWLLEKRQKDLELGEERIQRLSYQKQKLIDEKKFYLPDEEVMIKTLKKEETPNE